MTRPERSERRHSISQDSVSRSLPAFRAAASTLRVLWAAVATVLLLAPGLVHAQGYPVRPVKIIVPFPAGGTADAMPRVFADWLSRKWGQPVVVENRAGAGGNVGAETAFKADPDGYTLLASPPPPLVINQNLYQRIGFDPTQFVPMVIMGRVPNALVLHPNVAANSVAQLIALAKSEPGKLTSATQGNGTTSHLTSELFAMMAGIKFQHVPYRGSAPALNDLIGGNVDLMFDNLGVSLTLVKGGKLKLLGVATDKRMAALPDVPTIAETLPGFESAAWYAFVGPPGTPAAIADKINADVNEALQQGEIAQRLAQLSADPMGGTRAATAAYFHQEIERWRQAIKAADVKMD
ncbi:MAG: Bug family tripartite tricarboxylate transporter substrate binding protein [Xanthobacteraceae bacterium]